MNNFQMYGVQPAYLQMQQMQQSPIYKPIPQPTSLVRVTGMEGAKAYQMSPNSVEALFDDSNDIFYIKSTDGAGFPTIRTFDFKEHIEPDIKQPVMADYVTHDELNEFERRLMENAKQFIQQPIKSKSTNDKHE